MQTTTVTEQGQVTIPLDIRKQLGITPGCQLSFTLEGSGLKKEVKRRVQLTRPEDGYGFLICKQPGERHLEEFDVVKAMYFGKVQQSGNHQEPDSQADWELVKILL